ncbi:unnamed protein product [Meloidogyne enterolobii]|uniref:Uncharacterized protein n=1 Tax=Meloidogyne enterolobii TaxID=390850 RepID=A0ACB1AIG7_MELEN
MPRDFILVLSSYSGFIELLVVVYLDPFQYHYVEMAGGFLWLLDVQQHSFE